MALEDIEDYQALEAAISRITTPELPWSASWCSGLHRCWRMRRATAVETDLFQIQAEILSDRRYEYETGDDTGQKPQSVAYRVPPGQSRNGLSHVDQSDSIDHQCDPREASAMIQAAYRGI